MTSAQEITDAEQHGFTIDHNGRVAVAQRGLGDQRKAAATVMGMLGEQTYGIGSIASPAKGEAHTETGTATDVREGEMEDKCACPA